VKYLMKARLFSSFHDLPKEESTIIKYIFKRRGQPDPGHPQLLKRIELTTITTRSQRERKQKQAQLPDIIREDHIEERSAPLNQAESAQEVANTHVRVPHSEKWHVTRTQHVTPLSEAPFPARG
jgi:hypothetical protein